MGTVIGGLLMPRFDAGDYGQAMNRGILGGSQLAQGQTALLALQEEKQKQQSMQRVYEAIKNDPALAQQLLGIGPVLGSLQTASPPGPQPGPITQSPLGGGSAQQIPAYPDASRYANVSPQGGGPLPAGVGMPTVTPPQSTIASLSQPQGQMQAPQNPLLEMARRDPRAAMMLQDQQNKAFTAQLTLREKTAEAVASSLQGVNSQESYEPVRQDIARFAPQIAARLPQTWSKEAVQPFIESALSAKDKAKLGVETIAAQAELKRAQMAGRVATTDQYLKALGVTPGTEQPEDMQRALELQNKHLAEIEAGKVNAQIVPGPGGEYWMVNPRTGERRPVGGGGSAGGAGGAGGAGTGGAGTGTTGTDEQLRAPMTEGQAKTAGYTSRMQSGQEQLNTLEKSGDYATWKLPLTQLPGGRLLLSGKQKEYENAKGIFLAGLLRYDSQGQITPSEWAYYGNLYFPQYGDEPDQVEQKRQNREQAIKTHQEMLGRPVPGQKPGTQAPPPSQGSAGTGGQAGGNTFNDADIAATMANPRNKGKTRQQIVDGLLAKGMTYK